MKAQPLSDELIARLPSPQGVAFALTKACRSDYVNVQEIANLVRSDPALCGRLLMLANSAAAGGCNVIVVDDAVARIGVTGVSQVALAFSLIDQYATGACASFSYAGFWNGSLLMAAAAKEFGTPRGLGAAGELFTLGLLSQIGCLALATAFPREYSDLIVRNVNRAELLDQEGVLFGTNHLRLSAALMTRWGIPVEEVCDFCQYEAFKAVPTATEIISKRRAQLASTAWHVALAIAQESTEAVFERHDCFSATQWLQLDRDSLNRSLSAIESTWHLWLALISR